MHVLVCAHIGHIYTYLGYFIVDALCITAVSYSTTITCIRYVQRSAVFTRILRGGGALSMYHTWNDKQRSRRDGQASHDATTSYFVVISPLHTYHEAPLILRTL